MQKKDKEGPGSFWTFAIGEFVLVFLGILIALQVDNWNENRHERKLERVLLSEMLSNLEADLEDIEYNTRMQQKYLNSNQVILDFLQNDLPWHDSLGWHFTQLVGGTIFDNNNSAYESLKSMGIELIRNDSLRQQITLIYTARYHKIEKVQDMLFTHIFDHLYPDLRVYLRTIVPREMTVPVNLAELKQNTSFKENLHMTVFIYSLSIQYYQRTGKDIIKLIEAIEKELL